MSSDQNSRKRRAKDSASDGCASRKASAGGRKDGKGKASEFAVLPASAGLPEHMAYMKKRTGAILRSMRVDLGNSWCIGYELTRIKEKFGLKGEKWDAHCKEVVGRTSRQVRDYMVLAKAFGSAEEMIEVTTKKVGETASFANAVLAARATLNPEPTPAPKSPEKDDGVRNENVPITVEPDGEGDTGKPLPRRGKPTAQGSKGAGMLDDIIRLAVQFADDLTLLGKVHAILVKAEAKANRESASGGGCGESNGKAKSRRTAGRAKKDQAT